MRAGKMKRKFLKRILVTGMAFCMAAAAAGNGIAVHAQETIAAVNQTDEDGLALTDETSSSAEGQQDAAKVQSAKDQAAAALIDKVKEYVNNSNSSKITQQVQTAVAALRADKMSDGSDWTLGSVSTYLTNVTEQIEILAAGGTTYVPETETESGKTTITTSADYDDEDNEPYIDDNMRAQADEDMLNYMKTLIKRENPEQYILDELDDILYSGIYYIANSERMTEHEMWSYVADVKAQMDSAVSKAGEVTTTTEFLTLGNNWSTPTVSYGESVNIVLPLINLGEEWVTDVLVEPVISNDVNKWPFEPDATGYTKNFSEIPGCATRLYDEAMFNRREVTYTFTAREDVLTGYYPLTFQVWYSKDGIRCKEPAEVSVYVFCQGKPGSGRIGMNEETNVSQPRIIVTGFETEPAEVFAGDIFTLTIHVKNTSSDTAVNNLLFDLEAVEGGTESSSGTTNSYAAFLPTSGSSAIYVERMAAGSSTDLKIEMQAKADLSQKPYVVTVSMKYDTDLKADLTDEAKVSIPVKQESKFDYSTPEIMPSSIMVGEQSNVMFQIHNTGKTTLYNVKVNFEADSVSGGDVFLGNLQPGASGSVDAMVNGVAQTMDDGTVKAVITYEDDAGNATRNEVDINIYVMEMMADEGMMDMPMEDMMMEEEPQGLSAGVVIAIVAGAAVIAAAAVIVVLKLRKKKKAAKLLEEDLFDLDQDE